MLKHPRLAVEMFFHVPNPVVETYYARVDSKRILSRENRRVLFVDGGANLGQGFTFFASYYPPGKVEYDIFEPNPNCLGRLRQVVAGFSPDTVRVHPVALSTQDGETRLYGITESEGGRLSTGASINRHQHSVFYDANPEHAITVPTIDFCAFLKSRHQRYETIIVKLDIEGAENDVLEALIEQNGLAYIDTLYIEFHAFLLKGTGRRSERMREVHIIEQLKRSHIYYRRWH